MSAYHCGKLVPFRLSVKACHIRSGKTMYQTELGSDEDTFEIVAFTLVNIYNLIISFIRPCSMHQDII